MKRQLSRSIRWIRFSAAVLVLAASAAFGGHAVGAELPRYQFEVGQELTYRTGDAPEEANDDSRPRSNAKWIFTVLKNNTDGGWRILFRESTSFGPSYSNERAGYLDLKPDGKIAENPTINLQANPTPLFPTLPPDEEAMKGTWSSTFPLDETKRDFKATGGPPAPGDATWTFEENTQTVFEPIYEMTRHFTYEFDLKDGHVRKITGKYMQGWPKRVAGQSTTTVLELAETRQVDSPELTALDAETSRYFEVAAAYEEAMADKDFSRMKETLDKAAAVLKEAEGEFKLPAVQAMLKNNLDQYEKGRSYYLETAERFARLIGQPSDDWKTEDLEGNPRSLADYQGKVVLLDFWYRGCGWCIRAMPQLKQLSDDFPRDQVAVLGMNNDQNLDDAKLVIDKMGLTYETLKNGSRDSGIHAKYGVQGWPTLVVLDPKGVVRHVHVGYSPHLRKELGDKIRELLAEK